MEANYVIPQRREHGANIPNREVPKGEFIPQHGANFPKQEHRLNPSFQTMYRLTRYNNNQQRVNKYITVCNRCGSNHSKFSYCKAATRICYSCRRYGHYAQFCQSTFRKSTHGCKINSDSNLSEQQEHQTKIQCAEDNVLHEMPFYLINNEELRDFFPKQLPNSNNAYVAFLEKEVQDFQEIANSIQDQLDTEKSKLNNCQSANQQLQQMNDQLKSKITSQADEISELKSALLKLENDYSVARNANEIAQNELQELQKTVNSIQNQLDAEKTLHISYKSANQDLQQSNEVLQLKITSQESTISELKSSRNKYETNYQIANKENQAAQTEIQELTEKLESFQNSSLEQNIMKEMETITNLCCQKSKPVINPYWFFCNKCRSSVYHEQQNCPARGNKCGHCQKKGHFTLFCKVKT